MFIFKTTQLRANPYAPYNSPDGTRYTRIPMELLDEIPEPQPPEDYTEATYFRTEQDDAPYVVYTRKSDETIASARWEAIKIIRDDLTLNGGCLVDGYWFHTDVYSKQQQMALMMLGQDLPQALQWKTMSGDFVTLTPALVSQLFSAQVTREQDIFAIAETKRTDDSDIHAGWPARYVAEQPT